MKLNRCFLSLLLIALGLAVVARPATAEPPKFSVNAPHVEVSLLPETTAFQDGATFFVGVRMKPEPSWHVYWEYPGDSGSAPKFAWSIDGNSEHVTQHWPFPERIPVGPLMNYGYSEEVLLVAEFPARNFLNVSEVTLKVDAEWLVCQEECIPGNAVLELKVPISRNGVSPRPGAAELFRQARSHWPDNRTDIPLSAHYENGVYAINFTPPATMPKNGTSISFFPLEGDIIENAAPQELTFDGADYHLLLRKSVVSEAPSPRLAGILVSSHGWASGSGNQALSVDLTVAGVTPPPTPTIEATRVSPPLAIPSSQDEELTLWLAIAFAFVGGLILNIMPCVFPVLSIKILSFAEEAGHGAGEARKHGLLFGLGVIGSFWILGLSLFGLRAAGQGLGWGFQLQSPEFVLALIFVVFAIALNLLGVFEVGASVQRVGGSIQTGDGAWGAIGSGALAVVLATPCTAPFMGSALAYALTVPALEGLAVFSAIGLGMALPYMLLCSVPRLIRVLPRPGNWMSTFKHAMAFPLFATVIWLLWVLGIQRGPDAVIASLVGILLLSLGLSGLGLWASPARSRGTRWFGRIFALTMIALGASTALGGTSGEMAHSVNDDSTPFVDKYGLHWEHYSDARLAELLAQGRPVYIDFTAAWCITCQVNKRVVLSSAEVKQEFNAHGVTLLKADWTNRDERITEALKRYGRQGVPLNVLYTGRAGANPVVFPSILTPMQVLDALRAL